jgi:FkbM family methyltransferase
MSWRPLLQKTYDALMQARYGSRRLRRGDDRDLYQTRFGDRFWLTPSSYVDRCIIERGEFEERSTQVVNRLVEPGDVVLDVGANIGYYTVLMSRLVGAAGRVICFEPTQHFRTVLERNVLENNCRNVEILPFGLSDARRELEIFIGESSASLHTPGERGDRRERIALETLDGISDRFERIDFIKIDVDGHEPAFLKGAWKTIDKHSPLILLEVSHAHYLEAGVTAWDFYDELKAREFFIYHEDGLAEITNRNDFLVKCGNFNFSANIILSRRRIA